MGLMRRLSTLVVTTALVAAACGGSSSSEAAVDDFATSLTELTSEARQRIEEIYQPLQGPEELGSERFMMMLGEMTVAEIGVLQQLTADLSDLTVPDGFAADLETHLAGIGEEIASRENVTIAAAARSINQVMQLEDQYSSILRRYLNELSPTYRAWVAASDESRAFVELFGGLTEEEQAYFDGIAAAWREFQRRNAAFGAALEANYTTSDDLLEALAGAGAGTAFEAVYDFAGALTPPLRFEEDHERFLQYLEETVRLDRLIGEAAVNRDMVGFLVANHGLSLVGGSAALDVSPTFAGVAFQLLPPQALASVFDPQSVDFDASYGSELHRLLREFALTFPPDGVYSFFPQTSDEDGLATIVTITSDIIDGLAPYGDGVGALSPPAQVETDHGLIAGYFDDVISIHEAILAAATAGDIAEARELIDSISEPYCDTTEALSDTIRPVAEVYFAPPDEFETGQLCG